jgi:hypothetical protein
VLSTPGIIRDSLVLKHDYNARSVVPVSNGAMYLNGSDAELTIADDSSLDFATGDFSICFWANLLDVSANASKKILIKKGSDSTSGNAGFTLQLHSNGTTLRSAFYDGDSGANLDIASVFSNDDDYQWHHYAITFDRNVAMYAYKDGVLIGNDTALASHVDSISNSDDIVIGKYSTNYLTGYLCNFGIWSAALTQAQIKSIMWKNYVGLTSSETTNLVSWWNLDTETNTSGEAGTGGVKDSEGTNHGTLS